MKPYGLDDFIDERHFPHIRYEKMPAGTHIFVQGEEIKTFYIMVSGKAQVSRILSNGKMTVMSIITRPRMLGEIELFHNHPILDTVELLTDAELFAIPMDYCRRELLKDVKFVNRIAQQLAETLYILEVNSSITSSYNLEDRMACYILSVEEEGYFELDLGILPHMFGTTYRHLTRVIKKFREEGVIKKKGEGFLLIDEERLSDQVQDIYMME